MMSRQTGMNLCRVGGCVLAAIPFAVIMYGWIWLCCTIGELAKGAF
jgi:hypothetical protein